MTVPISNVPRRVVLTASGTGPYSFNFEILAQTDIAVYRDDDLLTLTTDYTVTINTNGTGFVTLTATPTGADQIAIVGDRTIERATDFTTGGDLFATSLNDELDSQTIFAQQNAEAVERALKAPQTDPLNVDMTLPRATDRAGKYLTFDVNGNPEAGIGAVEVAGVYAIRNEIIAVAAIDSEIIDVAAIDTDVTAVSNIAGNVTSVANIAGNVTAVAGNETNINAVATDLTGADNIGTVAGLDTEIAALGPIAADITAVASDATDIGTVAADLAGANTIGTVATDITNVNTVAGISADVTTVAGISTDVTAVAADTTDIGTVAADITNVNTVAGISADVTTVAGIATDIPTVALNVADITNFADVYQGPKSSDPAARNDSSALQAGDLYFDTVNDVIKVYDGSAWIVSFVPDNGFLVAVNNLSDVANVTTARENLGLEIGVDVQAYDADTVKTDVANTFTAIQTFDQPIIVTDIVYPVASFSWNSATASPAADFLATPGRLINAHRNMRRCVINDSGVVQYYLDPLDSTKKADGSASVLTGADGMVMVEVPKFYVRRVTAGTITTWFVSDYPLSGYVVHPAFVKDGVEVNNRYYSAYDACAFDVSASTYISGLNRDNAVSNTPNVDVTASTGDKLASVSGVYPMVGLTRAQFRTIAANRGSGWRQLDWTLFSAVQVLYLTEYQTFNSQAVLGDGNTNGTYITQSGSQSDSPHTIAGASNSIGNTSTNGSQASAGAKPGTAFMSYRGIENFFGNCWNWADGINVNVTANGNVHVTNNRADFADDTSTNMTLISTTAPTTSGFVFNIAAINHYFVASSVTGGSSSTYITDQWFGSTSSNRVVRVGGDAGVGAGAGAFVVTAGVASSVADRTFGARLAF